jgi:serine/threonine protein kinase
MNEIATCETLKMNPHPNISRYHGCVVEDGWIKGLSFDRYAMTLAERVQDERPLDIDACLRGIQAGVDHLHSLGLIHNDLHPDNIMMNGDDTVVIIDFDSSRPKGMGLEGAKGGTVDWTDVHAVRAERENDMYSMHLIWVFLVTGL